MLVDDDGVRRREETPGARSAGVKREWASIGLKHSNKINVFLKIWREKEGIFVN